MFLSVSQKLCYCRCNILGHSLSAVTLTYIVINIHRHMTVALPTWYVFITFAVAKGVVGKCHLQKLSQTSLVMQRASANIIFFFPHSLFLVFPSSCSSLFTSSHSCLCLLLSWLMLVHVLACLTSVFNNLPTCKQGAKTSSTLMQPTGYL